MAHNRVVNKGTKGGYVTGIYTSGGYVAIGSTNAVVAANTAGETVSEMFISSVSWSAANNVVYTVARGANTVLNLSGHHDLCRYCVQHVRNVATEQRCACNNPTANYGQDKRIFGSGCSAFVTQEGLDQFSHNNNPKLNPFPGRFDQEQCRSGGNCALVRGGDWNQRNPFLF